MAGLNLPRDCLNFASTKCLFIQMLLLWTWFVNGSE
uniref:Uncharacterized protein n=1 Tax=Anguilla anguilla TaxID=7936 RepID=A0A0E9T2M8_ANGAN